VWTYDVLSNHATFSDSGFRLLYRLYGAPVLMMLCLPETDHPERLNSEIFLDFFQIAIVAGLTYFTFFYVPVQQMLPDQALLHNVSNANLLNCFLIVAVFARSVRPRFLDSHPPASALAFPAALLAGDLPGQSD
jgi:hypothetical protein